MEKRNNHTEDRINFSGPMGACDAAVAASAVLTDSYDDKSGTSSDWLRCIVHRMSRALLRHPQLPLFCNNSRAMYKALHVFFVQWSARQQRASLLSLTEEQVVSLMQYGESSIRKAALSGVALAQARTSVELIAASPLIPLDSLARELQGLHVGVVLSPIAEILELARVLDNAQRIRTPFGTVNLVHLLALSATLCPAPDMRTLLLLVANSIQHRLLCAALFYEWSLIDKANGEALCALAQSVEQEPCDDKLGSVVETLLEGAFERLGNSPLDPAVTDTTIETSMCSASTVLPLSSCVVHQQSEVVTLAGLHDSDSDHLESFAGDVESEEDDDSDVVDAIDAEFWHRLCS